MATIVFYGKVNNETLETLLYETPIEAYKNTEWRKQMAKKCEELGAVDVRSVEYVGVEKPDFTKTLA